MKLKIFNVEVDGIDKCGKDSVRPYLFYLEPGKYLCRARGLISQIAYAKLYNRDIQWDCEDYTKIHSLCCSMFIRTTGKFVANSQMNQTQASHTNR